MGRPRKPTSILELSGAFRKNPDRGRVRKHEPESPEPVGAAPSWFTAKQVEVWNELQSDAPERLLRRAHRWIVETACILKAREREEGLGVGETAQLLQCISKMGLTPTDSSKASVPKEKKVSNPFARIAAQHSAPIN